MQREKEREKAAAGDGSSTLLDLGEDALDIPLEESLMEELRKQEERQRQHLASPSPATAASRLSRKDDHEYGGQEEEDDTDDMDSEDDEEEDEEEDDAANDEDEDEEEEAALAVMAKGPPVNAGHRQQPRSHHAARDESGETEMRRKENEEGLKQASKRNDIVLINDKIPKHLRTDERYYYCKHCDRAWPKTSFRNAQQFGAHCSNCARRQVRRPLNASTASPATTPAMPSAVAGIAAPTLGQGGRRPSLSRAIKRRPSAALDEPSARDLHNSGSRKLPKNTQPMTLGRMKAENRGGFLWFDALPTDLIMRVLSFLGSSPRDLGAISTSCHFFSIIAANDALWRRMFEARWSADLAARHSGSWKERFASRALFLKAKAVLPPSLPSPLAVTELAEEEGGKLKETWNALLADPKLKTRLVESVLAVSQPKAESSAATGESEGGGSTQQKEQEQYLVRWAPADENDSSAPEDRQRWVSSDAMTAAPVVSLPGCSSSSSSLTRKRRASSDFVDTNKKARRDAGQDDEDEDTSESDEEDLHKRSSLSSSSLGRKRKRSGEGSGGESDDEDDEEDDDGGDSQDDSSLLNDDDSNSGCASSSMMMMAGMVVPEQEQAQRRKFEEAASTKEARMKRKQLMKEKEERARKRRRKGRRHNQQQLGEGDDGANGANNDDVPLTKEDKERQQREFLRVLYNNRDYKPVILFFDRNA